MQDPLPTQQPTPTEPPTFNHTPPITYIVELSLYVFGFLLCIFTLHSFHTYAQKSALKKTGHYIHMRHQYDFITKHRSESINGKGDSDNLWTKELYTLQSTRNADFFASNECYRFALIKTPSGWQVTINNGLRPLGTLNTTNLDTTNTDQTNADKTKTDQIPNPEYRAYLNHLLTTTTRFTVEFRKKSNALFFYKLKSALLIDRVFKLKGDDFIGLKPLEYNKNGYTDFLFNLEIDITADKISTNNPMYTAKLNCLLYFFTNGLFKNAIVQMFKGCLLILDKDFQFVLFGDYTPLINEFLQLIIQKNSALMAKIVDDTDFLKIKELENNKIKVLSNCLTDPNSDYKILFQFDNRGTVNVLLFIEGEKGVGIHRGQIYFENKLSEYFMNYFKNLFNKGEKSKVLRVLKAKRMGYQKAWVDILKSGKGVDDILKSGKGVDDILKSGKGVDDILKSGKGVERMLVEAFYDYKTGWDAFDEKFEVDGKEVTLKDGFVNSKGREWFCFMDTEVVVVE